MKPLVFIEDKSLGSFALGTLTNLDTQSDGSLKIVSGQVQGSRISPPFDISSLIQTANSVVTWQFVMPSGTSILVESSVSLDSGASWGAWFPSTQGASFGGLNYWQPPSMNGTLLQGARIRFRQTLSTGQTGVTPLLTNMTVTVDPWSFRGQKMMSTLPDYYQSGRIVQSVMQAEGVEMDTVLDTLNDVLNQFFVNTATWKLDDWETFVGLSNGSILDLATRRAKIISRIRGYGTATLTVIQNVTSSFAHGNIAVIENWEAYTITIRYIDQLGVPPNQADLQNAVRAVLPAHLSVKYEFTYSTWDRWDGLSMLWSAQDALALTMDQSDTYI